MLTLDSLSLLLSKQSPTQASLTLSQQLRDMVGIGTLGADRLDEPTAKPPQKPAEQEEVGMGLTLMQINQARDAADETGKFLQREVEAEGRYWRDIVAVKEAGWAICRMPKERHTLAVKFGFSEGTCGGHLNQDQDAFPPLWDGIQPYEIQTNPNSHLKLPPSSRITA